MLPVFWGTHCPRQRTEEAGEMPRDINSCSYSLSVSLEKGPHQHEPSCLGIIGPVHSLQTRLVAPDFFGHAKLELFTVFWASCICSSPTQPAFNSVIPIFATDFSTQFYLLYIFWCRLSFLQQPFQCFWPNLIFPSPSKHSPAALPPLLALLCSPPPSLWLPLTSYIPCFVLHVCLLSSSGAFCLSSLDFEILLWQELFFFPLSLLQCFAYIRCSVRKFDDWELAVCIFPAIFSRVI